MRKILGTTLIVEHRYKPFQMIIFVHELGEYFPLIRAETILVKIQTPRDRFYLMRHCPKDFFQIRRFLGRRVAFDLEL
jgi:hypothetical protein